MVTPTAVLTVATGAKHVCKRREVKKGSFMYSGVQVAALYNAIKRSLPFGDGAHHVNKLYYERSRRDHQSAQCLTWRYVDQR
jgi:hypothetical protein